MSFSRIIAVFDGVTIEPANYGDFLDLLEKFINENPSALIVQECADYFKMTADKVNCDDLSDFLHDSDYLIDCEFLDFWYIGKTVFSISDDDECFGRKIGDFPPALQIPPSIKEFLLLAFSDRLSSCSRYLLNYVI